MHQEREQSSINNSISLDERYIDFVARTASIFERYPYLEATRYFVFKDLLASGKAHRPVSALKRWGRSFTRKHESNPLPMADVLVWLDGKRAASFRGLIKVRHELAARGISVQTASFGNLLNEIDGAIQLRPKPHITPPEWAKQAWAELETEFSGLRSAGLKRAYYHTTAIQAGLYDEVQYLLDSLKPQIILIHSGRAQGAAALSVAGNERDICSVELQHGMLQPFFIPLVTDVMLTWGESSTNTLASLGVNRERLIPLGSPRHDDVKPTGNPIARQVFLQKLNLANLPTLVFFSNGNDLVRNGVAPMECAAWLEMVAAKRIGRLNIVVRLHPNEDGALYKNCPHLKLTKDDLELTTILEACDVIGSLCSTVLLEGLLFDKRIWQFAADGWPDLADNWTTGMASRISSASDLDYRMQQILEGNVLRLYDAELKMRAFANHGRATQAVADYIESRLSTN